MKKLLAFVLVAFLQAGPSFALPDNFSEVLPGIYRGARMWHEVDYRDLAALDIRYVINLERFFSDDAGACAASKLKCLNRRITLVSFPGADVFFAYDKIRKAMRLVLKIIRKGDGAVYFHCFHGSDRTGALAAALVIRSEACGKEYDKRDLEKKIISDLRLHGFHKRLYPLLYANIVSWADSVPTWICNP